MTAPSDASVLAYEFNIEDALVPYFKARQSTWQVLTARTKPIDEAKLKTPRLELRVQVTGTGLQENRRPRDQARYRSQKTGTLVTRVAARRNATDQDLALMCGLVRSYMMEATQALNATNLPYYQIVDIVEASGTPAIIAENDEILMEIGWAISWWIKPEAWPLS